MLYFCKDKNNEFCFINKKGKKFIYNGSNLKENCYYYVLKTHNYIYEVLEETLENWNTKEKKSYWLNFYSPIGNYENLFLLPIVYVILLPGLLSFFMSKGFQKMVGIIYSAVPLYIIIYDLIYKIKLKKSDSNTIDHTIFYKSYEILKNIISIIVSGILCIVLMNLFLKSSSFNVKLFLSPILICGLCFIGLDLSKILKNNKAENLFFKCSIISFLVLWFGFLSFNTMAIIKQGHNLLYIFFLIPFWIFGLFVIYKYFIKKK